MAKLLVIFFYLRWFATWFTMIGENMEEVICVSDYNKKVLETMNIEGIKIFDTTLRDGEQTPGVAFSIEEKVKMAESLDLLGVDAIEAGFPITSAGEKEAIKNNSSMNVFIDTRFISEKYTPDLDIVSAYAYLKTLDDFYMAKNC